MNLPADTPKAKQLTYTGSNPTLSTSTLYPFFKPHRTLDSHSCLLLRGASSWDARIQGLLITDGRTLPAPSGEVVGIEDVRTSASAKVVLPLPGKPTRINSTCGYVRGISSLTQYFTAGYKEENLLTSIDKIFALCGERSLMAAGERSQI